MVGSIFSIPDQRLLRRDLSGVDLVNSSDKPLNNVPASGSPDLSIKSANFTKASLVCLSDASSLLNAF